MAPSSGIYNSSTASLYIVKDNQDIVSFNFFIYDIPFQRWLVVY